jgi:hypothetical protein
MTDRDEDRFEVTSYQQSGGITAGHVEIHAPQPAVRARALTEPVRSGDGFSSDVLITLEAPYAARELEMVVTADALTAVELYPYPHGGGMFNVRTADQRPSSYAIAVGAPLVSEYVATIITEAPAAPVVNIALLI